MEEGEDGFAGGDGEAEDAGGGELGTGGFADEVHQPLGFDGGFGVELQMKGAGAALYVLDAEPLSDGLELGELEQVVDGFWRWAVAVFEFGEKLGRFFGLAGVGDAFVGAQALLFVRDVAGRNADFEAKVEVRMDFGSHFFAAELAGGFVE